MTNKKVPITRISKFYSSEDFNIEQDIGGLVNQMEPGNMTLGIYMKHLEELGVDINYGDYIGYPEKEDLVRYYVVTNDGRVTSDLKHTIGGYKAFYRTIVCSYVSPDEFKGI